MSEDDKYKDKIGKKGNWVNDDGVRENFARAAYEVMCCNPECFNVLNDEMLCIDATQCEDCFDKEYSRYVAKDKAMNLIIGKEMMQAQIQCPYDEPLHNHHDGCPACEGPYNPLPPQVSVQPSRVDGLGLFAVMDIEAGQELGITHVEDEKFQHGYIRTPLGGFFNHSKEPNCDAYKDGAYIRLRTLTNIKSGFELTVDYWLYDMESEINE